MEQATRREGGEGQTGGVPAQGGGHHATSCSASIQGSAISAWIPRDRAMNFAATNAFQMERACSRRRPPAGLMLDQIDVERSPICRLDSDCWDVVLYFFNPTNVLSGEARRAYRLHRRRQRRRAGAHRRDSRMGRAVVN